MVPPDRVALAPVDFAALPGWAADDPGGALAAFQRSCQVFAAMRPDAPVGPRRLAGRARDWQAPCRALAGRGGDDSGGVAARAFFERHFRPYSVTGHEGDTGLFTGYFEFTLKGARARSARYHVPLYRRPGDLVTADLGQFSERWRGRTIAGRVERGRLIPYSDRTAIEAGALEGRGLELLWVDDPVDAFFLQIQGSGRIEMEDGSVVRVGYAGKNGHAYTAIGRVLIEMGALSREEVTMQSIRDWLAANPDKAPDVLAANRAYVFFREIEGDGPIGAQGVALTPGRSLAVDRKFLPLGSPIFLAADDPSGTLSPLRSLMVAQDTGGAIRGPVRGDIFFGHGTEAARLAGRARFRGRTWILLPRSVGPAEVAER